MNLIFEVISKLNKLLNLFKLAGNVPSYSKSRPYVQLDQLVQCHVQLANFKSYLFSSLQLAKLSEKFIETGCMA